ncbi:MAG: Smr/MutS family protein, partial [candidate division NC10 bacterium]|nr:Smr/MutS family protein [candidate division NC10 bacterium]
GGERKAWARGQRVWIRGLRQRGLVVGEADGQGLVEVQVQVGRLRIPASELEPGRAEREPTPSVLPLGTAPAGEEEIRPELNLIGKRREEAVLAAERYLDRAALAGLREVRLIHGKGMGILRRGIEEMLRNHPMVEDFHLASFHEGGAGATIVRIKP